MQHRTTGIRAEIAKLIERTVQESMHPFGLRSVEARAGEDHDGDPVIFVETQYDLSPTPVDTMVVVELTSILRGRLWQAGEQRFPHIRHNFDERQEVKSRRRARA